MSIDTQAVEAVMDRLTPEQLSIMNGSDFRSIMDKPTMRNALKRYAKKAYKPYPQPNVEQWEEGTDFRSNNLVRVCYCLPAVQANEAPGRSFLLSQEKFDSFVGAFKAKPGHDVKHEHRLISGHPEAGGLWASNEFGINADGDVVWFSPIVKSWDV